MTISDRSNFDNSDLSNLNKAGKTPEEQRADPAPGGELIGKDNPTPFRAGAGPTLTVADVNPGLVSGDPNPSQLSNDPVNHPLVRGVPFNSNNSDYDKDGDPIMQQARKSGDRNIPSHVTYDKAGKPVGTDGDKYDTLGNRKGTDGEPADPKRVGPRGVDVQPDSIDQEKLKIVDATPASTDPRVTDHVDSVGNPKGHFEVEEQGYDKHGARIPDDVDYSVAVALHQIPGPRGVDKPQDSNRPQNPEARPMAPAHIMAGTTDQEVVKRGVGDPVEEQKALDLLKDRGTVQERAGTVSSETGDRNVADPHDGAQEKFTANRNREVLNQATIDDQNKQNAQAYQRPASDDVSHRDQAYQRPSAADVLREDVKSKDPIV